MKIRRLASLAAVVLSTTLCVTPSWADDADDLKRLRDTTINLINALVTQGVIPREKADAMIRQAEQDADNGQTPAPASPPASASSAGAPTATGPAPTTGDLLNLLIDQNVITQDQADELSRQAAARAAAQAKAAAAAPAVPATAVVAPATGASSARASATLPAPAGTGPAKGIVRVPYVPEIVKQQMMEDIKKQVLAQAKAERWGEPGAFPEWLRHLNWSGDVRVRDEIDLFPTDSAPNAPAATLATEAPYYYPINDSSSTRNRVFVRARLGVDAKIADWITAGVRVATGGTGQGSNPATENVSLGNYNTRFAIGLDRAYLRFDPISWGSASIGRFKNPFYSATTLVWADTVSLEGAYAKVDPAITPTLDGLLIAGAFPIQLQDNEVIAAGANGHSKWLFGYQAGLHWFVTPQQDLRVAGAFYDYHRVEGVAGTNVNLITDNDWSTAEFRQKGNQVFDLHVLADGINFAGVPSNVGLVSKFREVNLTASYDIADFAPIHVIIDGDFVRNIGFHAGDIVSRTFITDSDTLRARVTGYQGLVTVGKKKLVLVGDWQVFGGYRFVERDAVLDAFTDADFRTGGTNAKGYIVGGSYNFAKNTGVQARWMAGRQVDGPLPLAINVLQIDVMTAF